MRIFLICFAIVALSACGALGYQMATQAPEAAQAAVAAHEAATQGGAAPFSWEAISAAVVAGASGLLGLKNARDRRLDAKKPSRAADALKAETERTNLLEGQLAQTQQLVQSLLMLQQANEVARGKTLRPGPDGLLVPEDLVGGTD